MTDKQAIKFAKEFGVEDQLLSMQIRIKEKSQKRMEFWEGVVDRLGHLLWNASTSAWVFGIYGFMKDTKNPMPDWAVWSLFGLSFILFWVLDEVREVKSLLESKSNE